MPASPPNRPVRSGGPPSPRDKGTRSSVGTPGGRLQTTPGRSGDGTKPRPKTGQRSDPDRFAELRQTLIRRYGGLPAAFTAWMKRRGGARTGSDSIPLDIVRRYLLQDVAKAKASVALTAASEELCLHIEHELQRNELGRGVTLSLLKASINRSVSRRQSPPSPKQLTNGAGHISSSSTRKPPQGSLSGSRFLTDSCGGVELEVSFTASSIHQFNQTDEYAIEAWQPEITTGEGDSFGRSDHPRTEMSFSQKGSDDSDLGEQVASTTGMDASMMETSGGDVLLPSGKESSGSPGAQLGDSASFILSESAARPKSVSGLVLIRPDSGMTEERVATVATPATTVVGTPESAALGTSHWAKTVPMAGLAGRDGTDRCDDPGLPTDAPSSVGLPPEAPSPVLPGKPTEYDRRISSAASSEDSAPVMGSGATSSSRLVSFYCGEEESGDGSDSRQDDWRLQSLEGRLERITARMSTLTEVVAAYASKARPELAAKEEGQVEEKYSASDRENLGTSRQDTLPVRVSSRSPGGPAAPPSRRSSNASGGVELDVVAPDDFEPVVEEDHGDPQMGLPLSLSSSASPEHTRPGATLGKGESGMDTLLHTPAMHVAAHSDPSYRPAEPGGENGAPSLAARAEGREVGREPGRETGREGRSEKGGSFYPAVSSAVQRVWEDCDGEPGATADAVARDPVLLHMLGDTGAKQLSGALQTLRLDWTDVVTTLDKVVGGVR
eukprot:Hpha_TRINITY_DN11334_c0_g1::TRINITY_DN11334_c0_g1_i1::g.63206::m.63206